jgi:hypothetical protein
MEKNYWVIKLMKDGGGWGHPAETIILGVVKLNDNDRSKLQKEVERDGGYDYLLMEKTTLLTDEELEIIKDWDVPVKNIEKELSKLNNK